MSTEQQEGDSSESQENTIDPRLTEALEEVERQKVKTAEAMKLADNFKTALEEQREKAKKRSVKASDSPSDKTVAPDEDVAAIIDDRLNEFKKTLATQDRDRILKTLTLDEKERQSILSQYEKGIVHSGYDSMSIERDLKIARAAVHVDHLEFPKFDSGSVDAAAAMSGGSGKPTGGSQVSDKDREVASMVGMDPQKYSKYSAVLDALNHK